MTGILERLRAVEVEAVHRFFKPSMRVLEIGGGNGYQAQLIHRWGCAVSSVDIADRPKEKKVYFPVQDYDGYHLPFADDEFDVVFSSNVLEHIAHLHELLEEITRVLKPTGLAIHILPTPAWRFWTSLSHYPYLVKYPFRRNRSCTSAEDTSTKNVVAERDLMWVLRRALFSGPHGEYPNAAAELWYFSRRRWLRVFTKNGFSIISDYPNRLFYTGYAIFPGLPMTTRKSLSSILGSSCRIFVTQPSGCQSNSLQ